jgi:hypothetical protein
LVSASIAIIMGVSPPLSAWAATPVSLKAYTASAAQGAATSTAAVKTTNPAPAAATVAAPAATSQTSAAKTTTTATTTTATTASSATATASQTSAAKTTTTATAADPPCPSNCLISGYTYLDSNNNGKKDPGEWGCGNVEVLLINDATDATWTTCTGADGYYSFANLPPGYYSVVEQQPSGLQQGLATIGLFADTVGDPTLDPSYYGTPINNYAGIRAIADVDLQAGLDAEDYNFAEELPSSEISKKLYLASTPTTYWATPTTSAPAPMPPVVTAIVPEPGTFALLAAAAVCGLGLAWRRRRKT